MMTIKCCDIEFRVYRVTGSQCVFNALESDRNYTLSVVSGLIKLDRLLTECLVFQYVFYKISGCRTR